MARQTSRSESRRISLGDDLRIARAREVTAMFADASAAATVEVDGAQVERVDAAGLQAVVVGLARLKSADVACHWSGVSPALTASAELAGLADELELP